MKFKESTECLVNSFVVFKYQERDLYTVPYFSEPFTFVQCECEIPSSCEGNDLR